MKLPAHSPALQPTDTDGAPRASAMLPVDGISRPPSTFEVAADRAFRAVAHSLAWGVVLVVVLVVGEIGQKAIPAVHDYGTRFLAQTTWDPNRAIFGILPQIWGPSTRRFSDSRSGPSSASRSRSFSAKVSSPWRRTRC